MESDGQQCPPTPQKKRTRPGKQTSAAKVKKALYDNDGQHNKGEQSRPNANNQYRGRHFMAVVPPEHLDDIKKKLQDTATYYIGQGERSPTGFLHYQMCFGFQYQKSLSSVIKLLGISSVEYVKDVRKSIAYCTKPETRVEEIIDFGDIPNTDVGTHNRLVLEAASKGSFEEAMDFLESQDVMFYLTHKKTIGPWLAAKFGDEHDRPLYRIESFNRKPIHDFSRTVVLVGPTNMGKTQFALAHFEYPLLVRDKNDYARYCRKTDGIVFDDLSFSSWNPMTFLHMVENETPITQDVKFGHVRIRARIPKFILVNSIDLLWPKDITKETKDACLRRMVIFHIRSPLYKKVTTLIELVDEFVRDVDLLFQVAPQSAVQSHPDSPCGETWSDYEID